MDLSVRTLGPDDFDAVMRADEAAFSEEVKPENREQARANIDWTRMFGAFDGEELCGTAGAYEFEVTLPGGGASVSTLRSHHTGAATGLQRATPCAPGSAAT